MAPSRRADPELDSLIDELTIDCYDEDEVLQGFQNAFEEDTSLPCPGTVVGEDIEVLWIGVGHKRRELIATCRRDGREHDIALLDVTIDADPATARLIAAYRRWIGA